jgi:hypothetical protein
LRVARHAPQQGAERHPRAKASAASPARARLIETNHDQRELVVSPAVSCCCRQALAVPAIRPDTARPVKRALLRTAEGPSDDQVVVLA